MQTRHTPFILPHPEVPPGWFFDDGKQFYFTGQRPTFEGPVKTRSRRRARAEDPLLADASGLQYRCVVQSGDDYQVELDRPFMPIDALSTFDMDVLDELGRDHHSDEQVQLELYDEVCTMPRDDIAEFTGRFTIRTRASSSTGPGRLGNVFDDESSSETRSEGPPQEAISEPIPEVPKEPPKEKPFAVKTRRTRGGKSVGKCPEKCHLPENKPPPPVEPELPRELPKAEEPRVSSGTGLVAHNEQIEECGLWTVNGDREDTDPDDYREELSMHTSLLIDYVRGDKPHGFKFIDAALTQPDEICRELRGQALIFAALGKFMRDNAKSENNMAKISKLPIGKADRNLAQAYFARCEAVNKTETGGVYLLPRYDHLMNHPLF